MQLLYNGPRADEAEELLAKHPLLATSVSVVDKVLHFIIRKEAEERYGVVRAYDLRKLLRSREWASPGET